MLRCLRFRSHGVLTGSGVPMSACPLNARGGAQGNKKVGVTLLQKYLDIAPEGSIHVGDQFSNTGNDFAARSCATTAWIISPIETKSVSPSHRTAPRTTLPRTTLPRTTLPRATLVPPCHHYLVISPIGSESSPLFSFIAWSAFVLLPPGMVSPRAASFEVFQCYMTLGVCQGCAGAVRWVRALLTASADIVYPSLHF